MALLGKGILRYTINHLINDLSPIEPKNNKNVIALILLTKKICLLEKINFNPTNKLIKE